MYAESGNLLSLAGISRKLKTYFIDKPVLKAYLFGSYARGEADDDSDLDILVELDFSKPIGLYFFQMEYELRKQFDKKIDLISVEELSPFIKPYIEKDKILVYEK